MGESVPLRANSPRLTLRIKGIMRKRIQSVWPMLAATLLAAALMGLPRLRAAGQSSATPPGQSTQGVQSPAGTTAPSVPVEEIIQKFAAKEGEFREARNNYTYSQSYLLQEWGPDGVRGGDYRQDSDIIFTPDGKRFEKITYGPPATLRYLMISQTDLQDLANVLPFVLTSEDLPKYNIEYAGREKVDEIGTYVFKVAPKKIEKGQRYFQGTIWVDDQDLQIVKSAGQSVPQDTRAGHENLSPHFETYRENIDGKYWFPTYTRADDVLHFKDGDVRIHMVVRYTNYKQFKSTIRILPVDPPKKQ
jgi:hypothetical protein